MLAGAFYRGTFRCKSPTFFSEPIFFHHNGEHLCLNIFLHLTPSTSELISRGNNHFFKHSARENIPLIRSDIRNRVTLMHHWLPFDFTPPDEASRIVGGAADAQIVHRVLIVQIVRVVGEDADERDEKGTRSAGGGRNICLGCILAFDATETRNIEDAKLGRVQWARSSVKRGNIGGREALSTVWGGDLRTRRRPLTMTYGPAGKTLPIRSVASLH